MTRGLSTDRPGTIAGCEPTAMIAFWKVTLSLPPSTFSTSSVVGPVSVAVPRRYLIFRAFTSCPVPPVSRPTTLSLNVRSLSSSIVGSPKVTPQAEAWRASSTSLATCSSALDGMQPR
jgi:hypothetical protein